MGVKQSTSILVKCKKKLLNIFCQDYKRNIIILVRTRLLKLPANKNKTFFGHSQQKLVGSKVTQVLDPGQVIWELKY